MNKHYRFFIFILIFSFIPILSYAEYDKLCSPIYFEKNGCTDKFTLEILNKLKDTLMSGTWGITDKMEEVKLTNNEKIKSLFISDFYFINSIKKCNPNTVLLVYKPLRNNNKKYTKIKFCLCTYDGKKIKYGGRTHYTELYNNNQNPFPQDKVIKELIHSSLLLYFK